MKIITLNELIIELGKYNKKELHVHHTWKPAHSGFDGNNHMALQNAMRNYHINSNGWNDIAQHITIFPDGVIVTGRDFNRAPISISGYNTDAFTVELIGNFDNPGTGSFNNQGYDKLDGKQLDVLLQLARYFDDRGKYIRFHRENSGKTCPGTSIDKWEFMTMVRGGIMMLKYVSAIKRGSKGGHVMELQSALNYLGYNCGSADGSAGPTTMSTIANFQKSNGLVVDGSFGPASYKKINELLDKSNNIPNVEVSTIEYKGAIRQGTKGDHVSELQRVLEKLMFYNDRIDGSAGPNTIKAIKNFQSSHGLTADGSAGPATYTKINEVIKGDVKPDTDRYSIIRPEKQTTIIRINRKYIKLADVILAKNSNNLETLVSMQRRTKMDFMINGGLYWVDTKTGKAHSLNLLIDEFKQNNEGIYSRFGFRSFSDGTYDFGQYKWSKDLKDSIGGSPTLVIDGKINIDRTGMSGGIITSRQPRSAIGMNDKYFYMVTVDGRRPSSGLRGMTINELANLMKDLKVDNAMNLDGGGSTMSMAGSRIINSPSENNRPLHNGFGIALE